jgi:hypothetical protein
MISTALVLKLGKPVTPTRDELPVAHQRRPAVGSRPVTVGADAEACPDLLVVPPWPNVGRARTLPARRPPSEHASD